LEPPESLSVLAQAVPVVGTTAIADTNGVDNLVQAWQLLVAANDTAIIAKVEEFGAAKASDLAELEIADLEALSLLLKKVQRKQFCRLVALPV